MREKLKDRERLNHIQEAIDNIFEFTKGTDFNNFSKDRILQFAIVKNLEIIGEAANTLTNEFRQNHKEINWRDIIGLRHVLVHGYYQIRNEIVWNTIKDDLPSLREIIATLISEFK